jgi:hypothetical protein
VNKPIDSFQGRPLVAQRAGLTVTRVGANLGAEITGVDLRKPISDEVRDAIEDALRSTRASDATSHRDSMSAGRIRSR